MLRRRRRSATPRATARAFFCGVVLAKARATATVPTVMPKYIAPGALLISLFTAGCADVDAPVDSAAPPPVADAPADAVAPAADAPAAASAPTPAPSGPSGPSEHGVFMTECLPTADTATCQGLWVSWLHYSRHDEFMAACTASVGSDVDGVATCQALWLHWWPTF